MPATYEPAAVEMRRYAIWEAAGVFHEEPDPARPAFVLSMPPPNITGRLHLGHGSTYTPMDVLTRYHRMLGENAVWLPGQDHAAIATEAVVVRALASEGLTRDGLGREAFLERVWAWRHELGDTILQQFRRLGFGPDWARDRFTMDDGLSAVVAKVFVELHRQGLIYRGTRLVNWDTVSRSTLSDAEVDDEERDGALHHVRYDAVDGSFSIEVATTRPETLLGDTAIAVHPSDDRYAARIGKPVRLPLVGRPIPIVADEAVDPLFGTGAVKVTPAHDPTDYAIGERAHLPAVTVIDFDGRIAPPLITKLGRTNGATAAVDPAAILALDEALAAEPADAYAPYHGLTVADARTAIVLDLEAAGALVRIEPRRHNVPISSRSGAVVEPLLSLQWFLRMESLAAPALAAYHDKKVRFIPERHGRTYEYWLTNIKDWNISRQIWWGHRLPVWYGPDGVAIVEETEAAAYARARAAFGRDVVLERDPDTLDTWFSSALWPFSILGWPQRTPEFEHWYPNSVLVTAREIIFLWVVRMVVMGLELAGDVPFADVFIAPLVFDKYGRKMSKSLGNGIDPLDLIERYGADATRFGIVQQMRLESQEMRFDERFCGKAREFNNKIWNALRYAAQLQGGLPRAGVLPPLADLRLADRWILTRLREVIRSVEHAYDTYEFGVAADALRDFIWYQLCDWYIESTKIEAEAATRAAVMSYVLNAAMRLLHPIAPFVTEEVWLELPHDGETIVTASWPDAADVPHDAAAASEYDALVAAVGRIREQRTAFGLKSNERLTLDVPPALGAELRALLVHHAFASIPQPPQAGSARETTASAGELLAGVAVRAPVAQLRTRYGKELLRLDTEVDRLERKLGNAEFTSKASPHVVSKEREKLQGYERERATAAANLAALDPPTGTTS